MRRAKAAMLVSLSAWLGMLAAAPHAAFAASDGAAVISAGGYNSCAIESGSAYCWGYNAQHELGDGSTAGSDVPVAVDASGVLAGKTLTQIATGDDHTCALDSASAAYCWGSNDVGQLGDGSTTDSDVPVAVDASGVLAGKTLTQIAAGDNYTCALDSAGAAYCWGSNAGGQLGDGSTTDSDVPVAVDASGVLAGKTLTQIAAGDADNTCALDKSGAAYCWGSNDVGQLGDGSTTDSDVPVAVDASGVLAGKTLTQITAGQLHACAVDAAGAAYCWGYNDYGELGDGSMTNSSVPVAVDSSGVLAGKILTQITAGWDHTCALDNTGVAYCWGENGPGELGDGSTTDSDVPVAVDTNGVLTDKVLTHITAGGYHTCAADTSSAFYCWGYNYSGELGDDSIGTQSDTDVPVLAGPAAPTDVTAIVGDTTAAVSWTPPASLDGGTLTGYAATATPGDETCSTTGAATCTITGLSGGTTYSITLIAETTVGESGASVPVRVTLGSAIAFTSAPSDTVAFGAAFSFTVTATGSPLPRITKTGRLPFGVRFTAHSNGTATIAGTPAGAASGVYPLILNVQNKNGTAIQAFTLTITRPPAIKKIPSTISKVGVVLNLTIKATGYPAPALAESGRLPNGLSFTNNGNATATIGGIPTASSGGRYPIAITAQNSVGTATRHLLMVVLPRRQ
jgi:alpha-tubulin suppressor-like RCC1 family protein